MDQSKQHRRKHSQSAHKSKFDLQKEKLAVLFRPEFHKENKTKDKNEKLWELMGQYLGRDTKSIQKSIISHVEYTLAMTRFNFSYFGCSQATAYSLRDRMIECFNDTNQYYLHNDVKRVYFLSMEYIFGRMMQNHLLNNDLESNYREALKDIGYDLNQIYEEEIDINLGHDSLGRIAACSIDSLCTMNIPSWAYGLRYDYGTFRQEIVNGEQVETPDYWLERGNPWELERSDILYKIRMYGQVKRLQGTGGKDGIDQAIWEGGEVVLAMAYDMPTTGYNTFNTNNLRLWRSRPYDEYEAQMYPDDQAYLDSVEKCQDEEYITSIFYPNENVQEGKEFRLKQQYFYCAATLQDLIRRFKKQSFHQFNDFADKNAIHLHETSSAIAILEMLRLLIDEQGVNWQTAWNAVVHTFSCAFYTIKENQMEVWGVDMFGKLLPRHLELVYIINHIFLEQVKRKLPGISNVQLQKLSLIDESPKKQIKMANLCIVACHRIVLCSELQKKVLLEGIFKDFAKIRPHAFVLIQNGANPRRWIYNANRLLSKLITDEIGDESEWLTNLDLLRSFTSYTNDLEFFEKFLNVRAQNKKRLVKWLRKKMHIEQLPDDFEKNTLFDLSVQRINKSKRQIMCVLFVVYRYLKIKATGDKSSIVPRFTLIGGKVSPGDMVSKQVVKLIHEVADQINNDSETKHLQRLYFIPNYNASKEHIAIPASDFNEQLALPGEVVSALKKFDFSQACTTISLKFVLNGSIVLGSKDATNSKIENHLGKDNVILFGHDYDECQRLANLPNSEKKNIIGQEFKDTVKELQSGRFGTTTSQLFESLQNIIDGEDPYLVGVDFKQYIEAQEKADQVFSDEEEFCKRVMITMAKSGNFSADKTISELSKTVWNVQPEDVPKPSLNATQRVRSTQNLVALSSQELLKSHDSQSNGSQANLNHSQ